MQCEIKEERGGGGGDAECKAATALDRNVRLLADSLADWVPARTFQHARGGTQKHKQSQIHGRGEKERKEHVQVN